MIKTIVFMKRRAGMSFDAFCDHWVHTHGRIAANLPGLKRLQFNLVRHDLLLQDGEWDGVACAWFSDEKAHKAAGDSEAYKAMLDDEKNFVDTSRRAPLVVQPMAKIPPAATMTSPTDDMIKTMVGLKHQPLITRESFNRYWRITHARKVCALPHLQFCIQNALRPDYLRDTPLFDAVTECWWTDLKSMSALIDTPEYKEVQTDELRFVDSARSTPLFVREVEIVRHGELVI